MPNKKTGLTMFIDLVVRPEKMAQECRSYSTRELIAEAHPRYKALSKDEQRFYDQKAKDQRAISRGLVNVGDPTLIPGRAPPLVRPTTEAAEIVAGNLRETKISIEKRKVKRKELSEKLKIIFKGNRIRSQKFYLMDFQYMVAIDDKYYIPLEVGLIEWSMGKGISREFHSFINPGGIPIGYRYKVQSHAEVTHKITIDDHDKGTSDYIQLYEDIFDFFTVRGVTQPVFCLVSDIDMVRSCLEWVSHQSTGVNRPIDFLFSVEDLLLELLLLMECSAPVVCIADAITCFQYEHLPETKCSFHEDMESKFCAIGHVKKISYVLSDTLSELYGYDVTESHIPTLDKHEDGVVPWKGFRSRDGFSSRPQKSHNDDHHHHSSGGGGFRTSNSYNKFNNSNKINNNNGMHESASVPVFASRDIRYANQLRPQQQQQQQQPQQPQSKCQPYKATVVVNEPVHQTLPTRIINYRNPNSTVTTTTISRSGRRGFDDDDDDDSDDDDDDDGGSRVGGGGGGGASTRVTFGTSNIRSYNPKSINGVNDNNDNNNNDDDGGDGGRSSITQNNSTCYRSGARSGDSDDNDDDIGGGGDGSSSDDDDDDDDGGGDNDDEKLSYVSDYKPPVFPLGRGRGIVRNVSNNNNNNDRPGLKASGFNTGFQPPPGFRKV